MIGKRVFCEKPGMIPLLNEGEYCKDELNGIWFCRPPGFEHMGNLARHAIIEHEDGTITVSPSILITAHDGTWHGFLERGVWRKC